MNRVYEKLAKHLDDLPGGFPETDSGLEYKILKRLFTPEEAETATLLTMAPEKVESIAGRTGRDANELAEELERMAKKGLVFRINKNGEKSYSAAQFVVGIWEYHLNDLDEDLVRDVNEYLPHIAHKVWARTDAKHLRVVPVSKDIAAGISVSSYEDAEDIIKRQSKIVVQKCICRKEHEFIGEKCPYPDEVCLSFGPGAYYYEENNLGRSISVDEALEILENGRKAGLVLQPGNAKRPTNICMCCGCCCQILKNIKELEKPAEAVHTSYYAQVNEEACIACGACEERCHMDAIIVEDEAHVNPGRCIGCGVCVSECPTEAMMLKQKKPEDLYVPPDHISSTWLQMAKQRGKL